MSPNVSQYSPAGLAIVQVAARGSLGQMAGFANLDASDVGLASGMRRVRGSVNAANPVPDINRVRNRGDDGYIAAHLFEAEPPDFNLEFESFDLDVENFLTGASTYVLGDWDMTGRGQGIPSLQDTIVLISRQAESEDPASTGNGYENMLILSSKYRPTPGDWAWQAVGTQTFNGSADRVTKLPWGVTLLTAIGKSDSMTFSWFSDYPCTMIAFIGDGAAATINLHVPPITAAKTKFFDFTAATLLTTSSVNVGASTATISAAPDSGDLIVGVFETTGL